MKKSRVNGYTRVDQKGINEEDMDLDEMNHWFGKGGLTQ